jgi:phage tail sheath protein FI
MTDLLRAVPPCGHIAGIYARSELSKGVHKPAANEVVETVQDLSVDVDDVLHGLLNEAQVNVIRISTARGIRLMGARTISSDPIWLFMNVRRLLINIERGIQASSQWLPFETNNPDLWRDVDRILRVYLTGMFQRGMLEGNTPDDAFFVDCSIATNPPSVTDQGQMIAVIGVRPPPPAEFVIVRVGRTDSGLDFIEGT